MTDPFSDPQDIASEFASAESFRGRLVLLEPMKLELDIPNALNPGQTQDRVTAKVTTVDGKGPVQIFSNKAPTGNFLDGPVHEGVWFSQDRIVKGLFPKRVFQPGVRVLARLETYKPGKSAGPGNPWGLVKATDAEKAQAVQFLANLTINGAAAPAAQDDDAPF